MKDYSVQHGKLYQIDLNQHGAQAKPTGTNDIATLLSSFHLNGHTMQNCHRQRKITEN